MFEQDDLEKYLRDLADGHESPYNPADWADMQARLQQAGLTTVAPPSWGARALKAVRKTSVWAAVLLLLGIGRQGTDTPPQVSYAQETAKVHKSPTQQLATASKESEKSLSPTPRLAYPKPLYKSSRTLPDNQEQKQSTAIQPIAITSPEINALETKPAQKESEKIALPAPLETVSPLPIAAIERVGKETFSPTVPVEALQPVGFSTVEPFMRKEITDIAPLPTESEKPKALEGYQNFDVYASEALNTNLAFKIGTERWYSIVNIGYQYAGNGRWGFGYGGGKELKRTARRTLNAEFLCSYIKSNGSSNGLSLLTQAKLMESYRLSPRFVLFMTLNGNMLTSDFRGEDLATSIGLPKWALLRTTIDGINAKFWLGAQVGVSVRVGK